jgi:hypothetical protein
VSQATFGVNRYGVGPSTVASRLTSITATRASTTPADAACPGRSPRATPTAIATAAFSTAANGETTEIGPAPSAAKNADMPNAMPMPYRQPQTTAPDWIGPPTAMASTPNISVSSG